jgi:hypothetical protein
MTNETCGNARCARYEMTQKEFRRLRGELWDASFSSTLGKRAVKLYKEIYGKAPRLRRSRTADRNHVNLFPCGILEQVYEQLKNEGVPLVKPDSWVDHQLSKGLRLTTRTVPKDPLEFEVTGHSEFVETYVPASSASSDSEDL